MEIIANTIGIGGTILILLAYFLLQSGRVASEDIRYSLMNFLGATGVLISLIFAWNLPAFIIESFWIAISGIGIWKYLTGREMPEER